MDRRDALAMLVASAVVVPISGCLNFAGLRPNSDDRDQDRNPDGTEESPADDRRDDNQRPDKSDDESDANEEQEDGDKSLDSDDVKQRDAGTDVLEFGNLQVINYEEQIGELEYGEKQISYTGEVENTGDEAYESVRVDVRVYDNDGDELGSYPDLTPELEGGEMWRFEIAPHSQPEEIDDHDIAVTGK